MVQKAKAELKIAEDADALATAKADGEVGCRNVSEKSSVEIQGVY